MATSPVLLRAIKLWALKGLPGHGSRDMNDDGTNTNNDVRQLAGRSSTEAMARQQGKASSDEAVQQLGGEAIIHNKLSDSLSARRRVCFFCLGAELAEVANEEVKVAPTRKGDVSSDALIRMLTDGSAGAMEAMARAHNKEMHALNGNIFSVSANTPRCDAVGNAVTKGPGQTNTCVSNQKDCGSMPSSVQPRDFNTHNSWRGNLAHH